MTSERRLAVYALTPKGAALGRRLTGEFEADLFLPERLAGEYDGRGFASLTALVAQTFHRYRGHVFIAACGVAVRAIAPHLAGKDRDPAVVVLTASGDAAISLLSGHLGGANDLARRLARAVGGRAVITTATDEAGAPAVEVLARDLGLALDNPAALKWVNGALAAGERVPVFDPTGLFTPPGADTAGYFEWAASPGDMTRGAPGVVVDWRTGPVADKVLVLRPRLLVLGVGCRRGAGADEILALIDQVLAEARLSPKSLAVMASVDLKRDEPGLLEAARRLGARTVFFTSQQLRAVRAPTPSERVLARVGAPSVCEAAAMLAAGTNRLLATKRKTSRVTAAIALAV